MDLTLKEKYKRAAKWAYYKKWRANNPDKVKEYSRRKYARNKIWAKEHRALLDYRRRLRWQDREYRKKQREKAKHWRDTSPAFKKWHKENHWKKKRPPYHETVLLWRGPRCVKCGCKFTGDNGVSVAKRKIICNDCLDELNAHDEAPIATKEIIEYEHEAGWVAAMLAYEIEYGRNLGYYYCPD